jgi:hypothetical protein
MAATYIISPFRLDAEIKGLLPSVGLTSVNDDNQAIEPFAHGIGGPLRSGHCRGGAFGRGQQRVIFDRDGGPTAVPRVGCAPKAEVKTRSEQPHDDCA